MAEELARLSGTPDSVIEHVLSVDFLSKCLRKAKFSADLLQDTVDACEINDLNALVLGSGLLSVIEASEKLFLMQDEASTVVKVCRKECLRAGVNFGDGAQLTPEELAENTDDEATAPPPPAPPAAPSPQPSPMSQNPSGKVELQKQPSKSGIGGGATPAPAAASPAPAQTAAASSSTSVAALAASIQTPLAPAVSASRPTSLGGTSPGETPDPNFLIKPPVSSRPPSASGTPASAATPTPAATTPHAARSHIPKPSFGTPGTPAPAVATPRDRPAPKPAVRASPATSTPQPSTSGVSSMATPSMNGRHTPSVGSTAGKPPRPSTAPLTARASTTVPLGRDRPSSAASTPSMPSGKLPSYAKPTASHQARLLKEDSDALSPSSTPPVTFASTSKPLRRFGYVPPRPLATPEEKKEPKKPIFDNIRSSLLRPTAAFLAWSSGKSKVSKDGDLKSSQRLQAEASTLSTRPPKAPNSAPPKTRTDVTASVALSPGAVQGSAAGSKVTTTPEPFRLASAERHQKAQEELQRKIEEKARMESLIPKFKATPFGGSGRLAGPGSSPKPAATAQTDV